MLKFLRVFRRILKALGLVPSLTNLLVCTMSNGSVCHDSHNKFYVVVRAESLFLSVYVLIHRPGTYRRLSGWRSVQELSVR